MKKSLFVISIVALVVCNLYFVESDRDSSTISLKQFISMSKAQAEVEEGWYNVQRCWPCTTEYEQDGVFYECWMLWGDISKNEDCFFQDCGYGLC